MRRKLRLSFLRVGAQIPVTKPMKSARNQAFNTWALLSGALALLFAANPAKAAERVDVALVIATDVSYSVDESEARFQRGGAITAFRDPEVGFAWRDSEVIREVVRDDGTRESRESRVLARDWDDRLMRSDDYLPPSAWAVRRELFAALGGFDASFRYSEDWDFVLRAAAVTRVQRVPGTTVEVRLREHGNASAEFSPERLDCLRALGERHGFATPPPKTFWEVACTVGAA